MAQPPTVAGFDSPTPIYEEKMRLILGDEESGFSGRLGVPRCQHCQKSARKMKIFMALTIILSLLILGAGIFFFVHHGPRNRHPGASGMGLGPLQVQEGNMVIYYNGPAFRLPGVIEEVDGQITATVVSEGDDEEDSLPPPPPPHGSGAPPHGSGAPPAGSPPHGSGAPPAGSPPAGSPPAGSPPAGSPPAGSPPADAPSPSADAPPAGAPPADPAEEPESASA